MSIIDSLFAADVSISDLTNPRLWLQDYFGGSTSSGETVSPSTAVGLSAYYLAIRAISEDVGKLPFFAYQNLEPRGKRKATEHPVYRLVHSNPNTDMGAMTFRETLTAHAMGWGNGYAEIVLGGNGKPEALSVVHPSRVTPYRNGKTREVEYQIRGEADGDSVPYVASARRMFHIHGLGYDGLQGYSVARIGSEAIGGALAAQKFSSAFFANNAHLGGILKHPKVLKDNALKKLRESWRKMYSGGDNAYKPAILEEGMEWEQLGIPPNEGQLLETRYFHVEDMARWFRITPHKLMHLVRATFKNVESLNIEYVQDTLTPWLVRWEQEVSRKLFSRQEVEDGYFVEHAVQGLLRGDQKGRAEYYKSMFMVGAMSQNDIREKENENPVENGDVYYIPLNMQRSSDAAEGVDPKERGDTNPPEDRQPVPPPQQTKGEDELNNPPPALNLDPIRVVFADAAKRILRKEEMAVKRVAKKGSSVPDVIAWATKFYAEHESYMMEILAPASECLIALGGGKFNGASTETLRQAVWTHIECSKEFIAETLAEGGDLGSEFAGGSPERVENLTESLMKELTDD
jgi:HK97 family phage portal protein